LANSLRRHPTSSSRTAEKAISERKEHPPILPEPTTSRAEIEPSQIGHDGGCEARLDLVFACARESLISLSASRTDILKPFMFEWRRTRFSVSDAACEDGVFHLKAP